MKSRGIPVAEIVVHFQILASAKLWLEFLYMHGPEEPKERNEPFELEADYNFLSHSMQADKLVTGNYQQLHANKMDNVEEMDKFLEKYNFPKLDQEEIENLNNPSQTQKLKL